MATYGKLTKKRGDFFSHKINLPAEDENAVTIDWTGATFLAQIRETEAKTADLLSECVIDTSHADETPPYVVLTVASDTADVATGKGVGTTDWPAGKTVFMDFQETRDDKPRTPLAWKIKIDPDISR